MTQCSEAWATRLSVQCSLLLAQCNQLRGRSFLSCPSRIQLGSPGFGGAAEHSFNRLLGPGIKPTAASVHIVFLPWSICAGLSLVAIVYDISSEPHTAPHVPFAV